MFHVSINGTEYRVEWHHFPNTVDEKGKPTPHTVANILKTVAENDGKKEYEPIAEGTAKTAVHRMYDSKLDKDVWKLADNWNRKKGTKIAITKALEAAGFDKPTRMAFWLAYENTQISPWK